MSEHLATKFSNNKERPVSWRGLILGRVVQMIYVAEKGVSQGLL